MEEAVYTITIHEVWSRLLLYYQKCLQIDYKTICANDDLYKLFNDTYLNNTCQLQGIIYCNQIDSIANYVKQEKNIMFIFLNILPTDPKLQMFDQEFAFDFFKNWFLEMAKYNIKYYFSKKCIKIQKNFVYKKLEMKINL
jgi:hypothetical protein